MVESAVYGNALALAWGVLAALALRRVVAARLPRATWGALIGLFAATIAFRALAGTWGPGDLRINLEALSNDWGQLDTFTGPAPIVLYQLLGLAYPAAIDAMLVLNLLASSLAPPLLALILLALGFTRREAFVTAGLLVAWPVLVAFAVCLNRQPLVIPLFLGGFAFLLRYARRGERLDLGGALLALALVVQSRPEGAAVLVLAALPLLLLPMPGARRAAAAAALLALVVGALAYLHALHINDKDAFGASGGLWALLPSLILFDPDFTPAALSVLWGAGVLVGLVRTPRVALLALLGVAGLVGVWLVTPVAGHIAGQHLQIASARYQTPLVLPLALGLALAVRALGSLPGRPARVIAAVVVLAGIGLTGVRPYDLVARPNTIDHELHFVRHALAGLPERARVALLPPPVHDLGFQSHIGLSRRFWTIDRDRPGLGPLYYLQGAACTPMRGHPAPFPPAYDAFLARCQALAARLAPYRVDERVVPAKKFAWHSYAAPTVHLALYRVPDPALLGETATRDARP